MGGRVAILTAPTSGEMSTMLLGEIDDTGIRYGGRKGTILGSGGEQLRQLLGNGYGRHEFHMELEGVRLERCRIISPKMVFTYQLMRPIEPLAFDDDEPDTDVCAPPDIPSSADACADDTDRWPRYE
jgi:hypothetical protein